MLNELPDIVLINLIDKLEFCDRLVFERVNRRFNRLAKEAWSKKRSLVFPHDFRRINPSYTWSSYLFEFRGEMRVLLEHCPNASALRFIDYKRLQVFIQFRCISFFENKSIDKIVEISVGSRYVVDDVLLKEMARVFPHLIVLTVAQPYPLVHKVRHDTYLLLENRLINLHQPQLQELLEDNERVIEDLRLCLELFPSLKTLNWKNASFQIK